MRPKKTDRRWTRATPPPPPPRDVSDIGISIALFLVGRTSVGGDGGEREGGREGGAIDGATASLTIAMRGSARSGEIVEETGHEKVAALTVCTLRSGQVWASVGESVSLPISFLVLNGSIAPRRRRRGEIGINLPPRSQCFFFLLFFFSLFSLRAPLE